jgi:uncharacterized protein (DUF2267 family)
MSATGLDVFDKTLQTTNIWLDEIMQELGPDRQVAWHALGAVLRTLRDRVPLGLAAHLGSQLPILVRGAYYDQWAPRDKPLELRSADEFLDHVSQGLSNIRPVDVKTAVHAVSACRCGSGEKNPRRPAQGRQSHVDRKRRRGSIGPTRARGRPRALAFSSIVSVMQGGSHESE